MENKEQHINVLVFEILVRTLKTAFVSAIIDVIYLDEQMQKQLPIYDAHYGSLQGKNFKESVIYQSYLSRFDLPDACKSLLREHKQKFFAYDWDLFYRLIFASFSTGFFFEVTTSPKGALTVDLRIEVDDNGERVIRRLEEMTDYQVGKMFEILIKEQISTFVIETGENYESEDEEEDDLDEDDLDEDDFDEEEAFKNLIQRIASERRDERMALFEARKKQLLNELELYALE